MWTRRAPVLRVKGPHRDPHAGFGQEPGCLVTGQALAVSAGLGLCLAHCPFTPCRSAEPLATMQKQLYHTHLRWPKNSESCWLSAASGLLHSPCRKL